MTRTKPTDSLRDVLAAIIEKLKRIRRQLAKRIAGQPQPKPI